MLTTCRLALTFPTVSHYLCALPFLSLSPSHAVRIAHCKSLRRAKLLAASDAFARGEDKIIREEGDIEARRIIRSILVGGSVRYMYICILFFILLLYIYIIFKKNCECAGME